MKRICLACFLAVLPLHVWADATALALVNTLRAEAGRPALSYSPALERIAARHARDMASQGRMTHKGEDGSGPGARASAAGYAWCRIAENVAAGQRSTQAVIAAWNGRRGHRRNMLDAGVTEVGIARASGAYWVMVLARPGCR